MSANLAAKMEFSRTLSQEDAARADFYALLARLFYGAPDKNLLEQLATAEGITAETSQSALAEAWRTLCETAASANADAVGEEYETLFIGVGKPEVLPFGSFYLAGFLMEKPLAELRTTLARMGLAKPAGVVEPEDHFSALCEVMRYLIQNASISAAESLGEQRAFYNKHFGTWNVAFCNAVEQAQHAAFYKAVACFAREFLVIEVMAFEID